MLLLKTESFFNLLVLFPEFVTEEIEELIVKNLVLFIKIFHYY